MDQQPEVKPLEHSGGYQNGHLIRRIVSLRAVCFDQIANGPKPPFLNCIIIIIIIFGVIPPRDDMIISRRHIIYYAYTIVGVEYTFRSANPSGAKYREKFDLPPPHGQPLQNYISTLCVHCTIYTRAHIYTSIRDLSIYGNSLE